MTQISRHFHLVYLSLLANKQLSTSPSGFLAATVLLSVPLSDYTRYFV